jgi:hypothetical protein
MLLLLLRFTFLRACFSATAVAVASCGILEPTPFAQHPTDITRSFS